MEQTELKKIKKMYGENFMKLCRELFPTLLEQEGILYEILSSKFSNNAKTLYEDITNNELEGEFKDYIYGQIDVEREKAIRVEEKTPKELLEEVGYDLIECTTEEEIQKFKKYYAENEELCTFRGGRLNRCVVFFAVKKDADDIKREDFKEPKREDEYGTSVMGIQFDKIGRCTVSIKNRYNHTVNNPDATYGNDLERIIPGLTQSFAKLLKERGLELNNDNIEAFEIPSYVVAGDGKYYKYNYEINGTYYCPGNIIIENGEVKQLEKTEKQVLIDYFIVDTEKKTIQLHDDSVEDSFTDAFLDMGKEDKIEIRKNKEKKTREIRILKKGQMEPIIIEINQDNQIIGYENSELREVGDNFLSLNKTLIEIKIPRVEQIGESFLYLNEALTQLQILKVQNVGKSFLSINKNLRKLQIPEVKEIGDNFLSHNEELIQLEMPELKQVGNDFLYYNKKLVKLKMPKLKQVRDNFLHHNKGLLGVEMPELQQVESGFLFFNEGLKELKMPKLEKVKDNFLYHNKGLLGLEMPELQQVGNGFLFFDEGLEELKMPKVEQIKSRFLRCNKGLTELKMLRLREVGNNFLQLNKVLTRIEVPKLEQVGDYFLGSNEILRGQGIIELEEIKKALGKNRDLEGKERQTINASDIVELDQNSRMRTSEINIGREMIDKINKKKEKEER